MSDEDMALEHDPAAQSEGDAPGAEDQEAAPEQAQAEEQEELSEEQKLMAELKEAITVERQDLGGLRTKMTVTVPRDMLDARFGKEFAELKREAIVPGFRKGHAPLKLVEKRFASDVGEQLKSQLLSSGYLAAVEKEDIKPLGDPLIWVMVKEERTGEDGKPRNVEAQKLLSIDQALEHLSLPKEGALTFSCEVEVKPEFELPTLEKIPVTRPVLTIGDHEVDEAVKRMRWREARFEAVEEGAVDRNDLMYTTMKMTVGDEVVATEDNFDVAARDMRIKGVPLTGLGDAFVGRGLGDTVTVDGTVPDDHERIDLRSKTARFEFTIREIKRLAVPPIDAEFLATGGYESEAELRKTVRSELESRTQRMVRERMLEQIGQYLVDSTTLEIPAGLSQRQADRSTARRMIDMLQRGVPQAEIEQALDEMRMKARDQTQRDLKLFFILEKIAEDREVEVSESELNGAIADIARQSNKRFDRVRDELAKGDGLTSLWLRLREAKVLDALLETAEVTDAEGPRNS